MKSKEKFKRIVVKIGTGVITGANNRLDRRKTKGIVNQIAKIADRGIQVIIVSSGAIVAGMGLLKMRARPQALPQLQACAAIGQNQLIRLYEDLFKKKGYLTAQILLTQDDLTDRKRYLNAKNTIFTLLEKKTIPIINENDTVSTEEIKFGDNDRLSSLVANLVESDLLIILSNIDGLYEYDPKTNKKIRSIGIVDRITRDIENLVLKQKSKTGVGGMVSKLQSAKISTSSGIPCIIANGKKKDVLLRLTDGERLGTIFLPSRDVINAKKHWIAYTSKVQGAIIVDSGAKNALVSRQKSLLASGVINEEGKFDVGDVISIRDDKNNEFARGLTNYSSFELKKIKGLRTSQIEESLGYKYYDEVVHRDNLVIL